jgi:Lon protease-like protein
MSPPLALFPLTAVLFPGTVLPLHIFEPRYRQLVSDCLRDDAPFGILRPGQEREAPPPGTVGCVARIQTQDLMPDGRSNILVAGQQRFRVQRYLENDTPYLMARVEEYDDHETGAEPPSTEELEQLFKVYTEAMQILHDVVPEVVTLARDPGALTFQVAGALDLGTVSQLRLLDMQSAAKRVESLTRWLSPRVDDMVERARLHERARGNGQSARPYPPPSASL